MKSLIFANRNLKEIMRDPLSWIFCLGFPLVMLIVMSIINNSIPPQAGMTLFQIQNLTPGIAVFGLTFVMLFAALLISGDRQQAFLLRIFTSPMRSSDYIVGYIIPLIALSAGQSVITGIAGLIMGLTSDVTLNFLNILASVIISIPSIIMFIGFGLLFGTLLNNNAAPGICSIIITFSGMFGGIWMDVDAMGGTLAKLCNDLPFIHAVKAARFAYAGEFADSFSQTGIVAIWAIVVITLSIIVFKKKMRF